MKEVINLYLSVWENNSDVTLFVIITIFISNCNVITIFSSVTVTDYIYFVITLCNLVYVTSYFPTLTAGDSSTCVRDENV